jgi:hypothetical protein
MLSLRHSHTTDRSSILASRQVVSIRIKARHRIGHLVYNALHRLRYPYCDAPNEQNACVLLSHDSGIGPRCITSTYVDDLSVRQRTEPGNVLIEMVLWKSDFPRS